MFARSFSPAFAALGLAMALGTPALAGPAQKAGGIEVRYADLDLATEQGERRLKNRVHMAAARVCGHPDSRPVMSFQTFENCRTEAIATAEQDMTRVIAAARSSGPALAARGDVITVGRTVAAE